MELSELKRKLKLKCDFNDDNQTIFVEVVYQCKSIKPEQFSVRYGTIRVRSVSCVEVKDYTLYIKGRDARAEALRDSHEFSNRDYYLNMKAFLQNFIQKRWEIGYDTKKGN